MKEPIDRRTFALGLAGGATLLASSARAEQAPVAPKKTHITMLLYPGTTMLDWVGPYEALWRVPGVEFVLAGKTTELVRSESGIVAYKANATLDQIERTDVLMIPGGAREMMTAANDPIVADWVKRIDRTTTHTIGICTGSLFLSHLGLLNGRRATSYWKFTNRLREGGATFVPERWVRDGKYWTSAGVSAGIDLTFALIAELYGPKAAMMAQLGIEYDPRPPFEAGSVRTAPKEVVEALGGVLPPHVQ